MQKDLLPKKNIWITRDAPLEFCWYKQFFIANTDTDCILIHDFYFFLTFLESLKNVFINMVTTLIMPAKIATLGLLKTKVFWNKGYGVIISVHNLINENFSSDSNYIVDVVIRQKFGNSGISRKEVTIILISYVRIWPEKTLFEGCSWLKFQ